MPLHALIFFRLSQFEEVLRLCAELGPIVTEPSHVSSLLEHRTKAQILTDAKVQLGEARALIQQA